MKNYKTNRSNMLYPDIIQDLKPKKNNNIDIFKIKIRDYIHFSWLILLCCSLWYCDQIEREIRLNKIFEVLDKFSYIEENILTFIYFNFLKYGNNLEELNQLLAKTMNTAIYSKTIVFAIKMFGYAYTIIS